MSRGRDRLTWSSIEAGRPGMEATTVARVRCGQCGDPTGVVVDWAAGPTLVVIPSSPKGEQIRKELRESGILRKRAPLSGPLPHHLLLAHPDLPGVGTGDMSLSMGMARWLCYGCRAPIEVSVHQLGHVVESRTGGAVPTVRAKPSNTA